MPTMPKGNRRGQEPEKNRSKNRLTEKASSFHGRLPVQMPEPRLRRPNTQPELLSRNNLAGTVAEAIPKLTKLLLNVTIQGSVGPVQVLIPPDSTVGDLIAAAVHQYNKEGRRPILTADPSKYDLHYSQFSLESLDREEKVTALGSRNFFMCQRKAVMDGASGSMTKTSSSASPSCSNEVEKVAKNGIPWLRFMDFLL